MDRIVRRVVLPSDAAAIMPRLQASVERCGDRRGDGPQPGGHRRVARRSAAAAGAQGQHDPTGRGRGAANRGRTAGSRDAMSGLGVDNRELALIHDYLLVLRGAERTFAAMADIWPTRRCTRCCTTGREPRAGSTATR